MSDEIITEERAYYVVEAIQRLLPGVQFSWSEAEWNMAGLDSIKWKVPGEGAMLIIEDVWSMVEIIRGEIPAKRKKREIELAYQTEQKTGRCDTKLGYDADARYDPMRMKDDLKVLALAIKLGKTEYFKDADNVIHAGTTTEDFETILNVVETAMSDRFRKRHLKLAEIEAATTVGQIESIIW